MSRNMHTHYDAHPKRRRLRLAAVVASALVAGGIIVPASAAVAVAPSHAEVAAQAAHPSFRCIKCLG